MIPDNEFDKTLLTNAELTEAFKTLWKYVQEIDKQINCLTEAIEALAGKAEVLSRISKLQTEMLNNPSFFQGTKELEKN